jgi:uncharacterized protein YjbI with pentapeptide repeats
MPTTDHYFEDQVFHYQDHSVQQPVIGTYEGCTFLHGNFTGADFSNCRFIDCRFEHCILDRVNVNQVSFSDVQFLHCKMQGIYFDQANAHVFIIRFEDCWLNFCCFQDRKMANFQFKQCELQETDFSNCDLSSVVFQECNLQRAIFHHTNLSKADLRTAFHYSIDPEKNQLTKARFSLSGIAGLLEKHKIEIE